VAQRVASVGVDKLSLINVRNYEDMRLEAGGESVVLFGPNGAGKTNLLEAISYLSPGRGLRGSKISDVQRQGSSASTPWVAASEVQTAAGPVKLGTGRELHQDRRLVRINGADARSQADLAEYLSVVWLTPQMDRLFLDGNSARRRFLDRLVFGFDPSHAGRLTRYENAMRQRIRILKDCREKQTSPDNSWLNSLEQIMAETGVSLAAARVEMVQRLMKAVKKGDVAEDFPAVRLQVSGWAEDRINEKPALELEEELKIRLTSSRTLDAESGLTHTGPHRADLNAWHGDHGREASGCSTGEQKALLIGIVLANARLMKAEKGHAPVLLLDEVAAHLDDRRRAALYEVLQDLGGQVWLTGTDRELFAPLNKTARLFEVQNAALKQV